jgi:hypothetical protein
MLEKLRKMLADAGIDPAVGSIDYWGTQLEHVLLDMYDQGAAAERKEHWYKCVSDAQLLDEVKYRQLMKLHEELK